MLERLARGGREVALGVGEAAVVEGIAVEAVAGEQLADEAQGVLLVFGKQGIEEGGDLRRVVLDVAQTVGAVFDAGASGQCRVGVGRTLPEGGEPSCLLYTSPSPRDS